MHTRYVPPSRILEGDPENEGNVQQPQRDDLNRDFPDDPRQAPTTILARELWILVEQIRPMLFLDLHEGWGFHGELTQRSKDAEPDKLVHNPNFSKGSSVISTMNGVALANIMAEAVNKHIKEKPRKFQVLTPPIAGGLARRVHNAFGTRSFVLETTQLNQSLEKRVLQHLQMVAAVLKKLGLFASDFRPSISKDKLKALQHTAAESSKHTKEPKSGTTGENAKASAAKASAKASPKTTLSTSKRKHK